MTRSIYSLHPTHSLVARVIRVTTVVSVAFLSTTGWAAEQPEATLPAQESHSAVEQPSDEQVVAHVAAWEGVWAGMADPTPLGAMPMAMHFQRQDDGSVLAHSAESEATWLEVRFHRDEDGAWLLTEAAAMEGLGLQEYTCELAGIQDGALVWKVPAMGDFMTIWTAVSEGNTRLHVELGGKTHTTFVMNKLAGPEAEAVAAQLASVRGKRPTKQSR